MGTVHGLGWLQCLRMTNLWPPGHCHLLLLVFAANLGLKPRAAALGEQPAYQGPVHCIATIVRNEGLAGLYRGANAMLLRDVPGYCLYFIPYVLLSDWITPEACAGPSPCAVWLAGGMAGKAAALIPVPMLATAVGQLGSLPCPPQPQGRAGFIQEFFVKDFCVPDRVRQRARMKEWLPHLSPLPFLGTCGDGKSLFAPIQLSVTRFNLSLSSVMDITATFRPVRFHEFQKVGISLPIFFR